MSEPALKKGKGGIDEQSRLQELIERARKYVSFFFFFFFSPAL